MNPNRFMPNRDDEMKEMKRDRESLFGKVTFGVLLVQA